MQKLAETYLIAASRPVGVKEIEIERYLKLGEVVTSTTVIESISDEKQTRLGPGHFVTWISTYATEEGEVVGIQRFRILKFKPAGGGA